VFLLLQPGAGDFMEDPWRLFIRLLGCYAKEGTDVSAFPSTFTPLHTYLTNALNQSMQVLK